MQQEQTVLKQQAEVQQSAPSTAAAPPSDDKTQQVLKDALQRYVQICVLFNSIVLHERLMF